MAIRIDGTNTTANPGITGADADTGLQFGTDEVKIVTGGTDAVTVDASQRVGIGTASPGNYSFSDLVVNGATGGMSIVTGTSDTGSLVFADGVAGVGAFRGAVQYNHSVDSLIFAANGGEKARIDSSGRVGIGTTAPPSELVMLNGSNVAALIRTSAAAGTAQLKFNADDVNYAGIGLENTALVLRCSNSSTPTERMRIDSNGTAIFYYLIYAPQLYTNSVTGRDVYVDSNGQLGYLSSTQESKINIQDLGAIDWIYSLSPKSFNYRKKDEDGAYTNEFEQELEYGLIAEEVEAQAPDVCFYNEQEDGSKELAGVSYRKLIAPMLKALQQANERIETLETRVAQLEGGQP